MNAYMSRSWDLSREYLAKSVSSSVEISKTANGFPDFAAARVPALQFDGGAGSSGGAGGVDEGSCSGGCVVRCIVAQATEQLQHMVNCDRIMEQHRLTMVARTSHIYTWAVYHYKPHKS